MTKLNYLDPGSAVRAFSSLLYRDDTEIVNGHDIVKQFFGLIMIKNTSGYLPFARKYRPGKFSELMGQEVLTKTLSYCISNNRLAQAHLLTGIRGVGKTSSARIIAKTINCTDLKIDGTEISPCENCNNCQGFNNHSHPDIIEIDAASRTGVDDVREIIESCEYRPLLGKYKVFIIDEVHMLSKNAFNALLKIIEEPPPCVIFLFATTEVQKLPITVISRCQRYDLRRLTFDEIYALIDNIAKRENLKFEDEALKIIADKSEGSARDATSMLDQAASYAHNISDSKQIITAEVVSRMLGLVQTGTIIRIVQLIIANDPEKAVNLVQEIYKESSSLQHLIETIADFIADLSHAKVIPNYHNPLYKSYTNQITELLLGASLSRLSILWQIFSNGIAELKTSHNELITAQMLVIKAIYSCNLPTAEEIMSVDTGAGHEAANSSALVEETSLPEKKSDEREIFDFLKYCHKQNEMEIYYLLFNEVEVIKFANQELSIASSGSIKTSIIDKIKSLLENCWPGEKWLVLHKNQAKITGLKNKMMDIAASREDFRSIKNNFPGANISDILLET
jgi:DNA polymerase-3 subunit gamma/tau